MEAPDILGVLIIAAIMNLFFGRTDFAFFFVIVLPMILLIVLYLGKRGKPDGFLMHLIRFYLTKGYFSAGENQKDAEIILTKRINAKYN